MRNHDNPQPRAVFDCMVFLQGAARHTGPASSCLKLVEDGRVELFLSPAVLAEVRDVLTRPKLQIKFPILTAAYVDDFLTALVRRATLVHDVPIIFRYERDPMDEPYLNLAIAVEANFLVTRDNDLLSLIEIDIEDGEDFRRRFPDISILDPVEFLRALTRAE